MSRDIWLCLIALVIALGFGVRGIRRDAARPTTHPHGAPLPPLNTPIPQDLTISPTYEQSASSGRRTDFLFMRDQSTGISYKPMDFQVNGVSVAYVHKRGVALVYVIGGKEVAREEFYRFMDAWLMNNVGIWTPPQ